MAPSATSARKSSRQYHDSPSWSHSSSTSSTKPVDVASKRERGTRDGPGCPAVRIRTMSSTPCPCKRHCGMVKSQNASRVNTPSGGAPVSRNVMTLAASSRPSVSSVSVMLAPRGGHVGGKHGQGFGELVGRAEFDHFGAGGDDGQVARSSNVRIPCSVRVLAVGIAQAQLASHNDAPVRALATVVRQALEDRRAVRIHVITLENDSKFVEFDVPTGEYLILHYNRSFCLAGSRHRNIPFSLVVTP